MRYVRDAPLATIRADLGIAARVQQVATASQSDPRVDEHKKRIASLEKTVAALSRTIDGHVDELAHLSSTTRGEPLGDLIQNCTTATVHRASTTAIGRTRGCGWAFDGATFRARRQVSAKSFRVLTSLEGIPGELICERCLKEERITALERDLVHNDLSGDEQPIDE